MRTTTRALVGAAVAALTITAAGCSGSSGHSASTAAPTGRTIAVSMTDNAFQPTRFTVARGETVTFTFTNDGKVTHEAVLGDEAAQMSHHQQMTGSTDPMDHHQAMTGSTVDHHPGMTTAGGMGHGHADAPAAAHDDDAVTVQPGKQGSLTHTFSEVGTYIIGCHEPGHWESGMKATVEVT